MRGSVVGGHAWRPKSGAGSESLEGIDAGHSASSLGVGATPGILDVDIEVVVLYVSMKMGIC
jgi:hypothetical protein